MNRKVVLLVLLVAGGGYFFSHYRLEGLDQLRVRPRAGGQTASRSDPPKVPIRREGETLRVATFNIQVFGRSKADKPPVMEILTQIARHFDVLAIQEIRAREQDILPRFVERINAAGRQYDYVIGPRLGRTNSKEQYAYIFDRESVEVDRRQVYTIDDPDDLLHRPPLVAHFRVRGPPAERAFTFTLVNVHTDPDEVQQELDVLDDVYRAVRDDGRQEDDIIVLGDFNADDRQLGQLGQIPGMAWALRAVPTNTRQTRQYDNLLFHGQASSEFTGRAGVLNFMREYNLSLQEALEVSDHLPVWAEFSIYEGGRSGRLADRVASEKAR